MRSLIANTLFLGLLSLGLLTFATSALAHTPLFSCFDNGDGSVTCEGGFSDGSSAAGVAVHILDGAGNAVEETKLDEFSEITFTKPDGDYSVQFDAGEGHQITVAGKDIVE
jgi:hypothetical protein